MVYVALLRGINVGGNSKVEMPRLKRLFESLDFLEVVTYINSGNVVFYDKRSADELSLLIEEALTKEFGLAIPVILRDLKNINNLCQKIPAEFTNDTNQKTDIMFLWNNIDSSEILKKVAFKPQIERVSYIDGALVWNIDRQNVTKGSGIKLIKTDLYKYMTIRNINTVRKLKQIMQKIDESFNAKINS
jgi:uncharacterized protein (DUF1697 family)